MTLIERSENLIWTCSGAKTKPSSGAKRNSVKPPNGLLARTQSFHFAGERDCLQQNIKITLTDCHHHLTRLPCHVGGRGDDCQGDGRVGRESRQAELENEEKQHLLLKFHQCTTAIIEVAALPKYQFSFYFFFDIFACSGLLPTRWGRSTPSRHGSPNIHPHTAGELGGVQQPIRRQFSFMPSHSSESSAIQHDS